MTRMHALRTTPDGLVAGGGAVAVMVVGAAAARFPTPPVFLVVAGVGVPVAALLPTPLIVPVDVHEDGHVSSSTLPRALLWDY